MPTALLSVRDKSQLVEFARALVDRRFDLLASGETAAALRAAGLEVQEVADYTGSPEVLGGRVKTLHPAVHGGILSRRSAEDEQDLVRIGARRIDLVAVSLYPFLETVASGADRPAVIEEIDIGGVALLRAAAKNHDRVWVVPGPGYYADVLKGLDAGDADLRRHLAAEAFRETARYDMAIADYLAGQDWPLFPLAQAAFSRVLRYGENPHQVAALYRDGTQGIAAAQVLQGKELSYNNLLDADAAWRLALDLPPQAACVIKHQTPSGAASLPRLQDSLAAAVAADDEAAFGGVIALRGTIDEEVAEYVTGRFFEVVAAEGATAAALEILRRKPNLRVLALPAGRRKGLEVRVIGGGLVVQSPDDVIKAAADWQHVAGPAAGSLADLMFACTVAKHARSNAIVIAKHGVTLGIGAGQVSRVRAAQGAFAQAGGEAQGAVLASDGFFPFGDVVQLAAEHGIAAIVEPGGSVRDEESRDVAQGSGISLYFTGERHFRH